MTIKRITLLLCCLLIACFTNAQPGSAGNQTIDGFNLRTINFEKSWAMQQQALAVAKAAKNNAAIVKAYALLSISCRRNKDTVQMKAYIDSANSIQEKNIDEGFTSYAQARYFDFIGNSKTTADNYLKALNAFELQKNYAFATLCAADISHLFEAPSDSIIANKYNVLAQAYAKLDNTPDAYLYAGRCHADYLLRQQKIYKTEKGIKKTAAAYQQTITAAEQTPEQIYNKSELAFCYLNLAVIYQNNQYLFSDAAFLNTLEKAKNLAFTYNFKSVFRNAYGLMGDYYISKNNFAAAKDNYLTGIDMAKKLVPADNSSMLAFYKSLKNMAAMQQDWKQFQHFDSAYGTHAEKRFDEAIKQAVHEADIKFEATQKTQQINTLQQENKYQKKNKLLFLFIAILVLVAAIFMVRSFYFKMNYSQQQEAVLRIKKEVAEKDKTLLENKLLQSQMKPHFMFNTLGAIHGIVLQNKTQEAASLIIQFSKLMRKMLENTQQEWLSFEDEIEMLQHYTSLQQVRFNHRFNFEITTNNIGSHIVIPPMLIQPFIENAIEHGFKNLPENKIAQLNIIFEKASATLLRCTITDNGCGRKSTTPIAEKNHTSMATQLTQQRLQYYEPTYPGVSLQITDLFEAEQPTGTRVTILLPYQTD